MRSPTGRSPATRPRSAYGRRSARPSGCRPAPPKWVGNNRMDYFVELASESDVRDLNPDFAELTKIPARGVIVTAKSDSPEFDFVSRFFCPACGINEDPATGSAHCALGPFWG